MFGPSQALADAYAELILSNEDREPALNRLFSDYIRRWYAPDPATGRPRRVMMLLFTGDNAVEKIASAAGTPRPEWHAGETIRDTYGDYVAASEKCPVHFEPAVFIATSASRAAMSLELWSKYSETDGGLIEHGADVDEGHGVQKTLVLLKPDNFRAASLRVGNIIDLFSRSGLKIVGIRILRMTLKQARDFYGSVHGVLRRRNRSEVSENIDRLFQETYGVQLTDPLRSRVVDQIGDQMGDHEFDRLLAYLTGACAENPTPDAGGGESCLALVYKGTSAIEKIRHLLGSTDPRRALPGSVRYEFGSDIMANAAHASDSPDSVERELGIIDMQSDTIHFWVEQYYGSQG